MIQADETARDATALGAMVPENPIPLGKKTHLQVCQSRLCKHLTVMADSNRFACGISYPNTAAARFLLEPIATEAKAEVDAEIGALVTTAHLVWPNQPRKLPLSLRFWLPILILSDIHNRKPKKTNMRPEIPNMKNGSNEHNFESITETLRRQNAALEILVHHLAYVEAAVGALTFQIVPDEAARRRLKKLKDRVLSRINNKMGEDLERLIEDF